MGRYSIKELEKLSGIKAHTIRIWEKRHQIIEPQRTPTNIRFYSDDDLKKIINVSVLNNNGVKISKIAGMSLSELNEKVYELSTESPSMEIHIEQMVVAMIDMEEAAFEKIISHITLKLGFEKAVTDVIYPFLEKIGVLWQTGNITPAQEHFISNIIRQKVIVAIDSLPIPSSTSLRVILYLPENELHEIGLLFYNYITRKQGMRTYYLGQNLPFDDLIAVGQIHRPHFVITAITTPQKDDGVRKHLQKVVEAFPYSNILATGPALRAGTPVAGNLRLFHNALELKQILSV